MSSASSPYSLSNSLTSSFAFSKFSFSSYVSVMYLFHYTKNLFFPYTFLLFKIFSTSYSSSPSITIGCSGTTFWPSTWGLYSYTLLTLTTGCILIAGDNSSSIVFVEMTFFTLYRPTDCFVLLPFICYFRSFILSITKSPFWYLSLSFLFLSIYHFIFS